VAKMDMSVSTYSSRKVFSQPDHTHKSRLGHAHDAQQTALAPASSNAASSTGRLPIGIPKLSRLVQSLQAMDLLMRYYQ
jgi:hypothetical protein